MDARSQDPSSAGMAWAIEANLNGTFSLLGSSPSTQLHDEDPGLRWYITPKVPHALFNHVYFTRLPQEEDVDARIEELTQHFASRQLPLMWSVGPFSRPSALASHLESHGQDHQPGDLVPHRLQGVEGNPRRAIPVHQPDHQGRHGPQEAREEVQEDGEVGQNGPSFLVSGIQGCGAEA